MTAARTTLAYEMNVEPMQLAALLIEKTTEQLSEKEAEALVHTRH
jgi:hypothetical protein